MKSNYEDFVNDYKELKEKAMEMSVRLNAISKHFVNMKNFRYVEYEIDDDSVQISHTEYTRCGDDDTFYFTIPTKVLFCEEDCVKYIQDEQDKLEQKRLKLQQEKEEKLRKEEEQKRLNELKKIEEEKKKLIELSQKYPELVKN